MHLSHTRRTARSSADAYNQYFRWHACSSKNAESQFNTELQIPAFRNMHCSNPNSLRRFLIIEYMLKTWKYKWSWYQLQAPTIYRLTLNELCNSNSSYKIYNTCSIKLLKVFLTFTKYKQLLQLKQATNSKTYEIDNSKGCNCSSLRNQEKYQVNRISFHRQIMQFNACMKLRSTRRKRIRQLAQAFRRSWPWQPILRTCLSDR